MHSEKRMHFFGYMWEPFGTIVHNRWQSERVESDRWVDMGWLFLRNDR
jgi:hypothetical protein